MANINHYKSHPMHVVLILTVSDILTFHIFLPSKRSRLSSIIFFIDAIRWQMYKYITVICFTFFIFAKILPVHTKVTHTGTDTQKIGHAHGYRLNLADLPKKYCL